MVARFCLTPPIQSYTNHARKRVRSRSGTHGKISQHNSTNKNKSYKHYITSQGPRGLEYISSNTQESVEATISEYRHKLDKFALRRLAQKQHHGSSAENNVSPGLVSFKSCKLESKTRGKALGKVDTLETY